MRDFFKRKITILLGVFLILIFIYLGLYFYFAKKIDSLYISARVNAINSDLSLQVNESKYIFPFWLNISKANLYYKEKLVIKIDTAKIKLDFFSILGENKKIKYDIATCHGRVLGKSSKTQIEANITNLDIGKVAFFDKYLLKGVLDLAIELKVKDKILDSTKIDLKLVNFGIKKSNRIIKDTSLIMDTVFLKSIIRKNSLKLENFVINSQTVHLISKGKVILNESKTNFDEIELFGKIKFEERFFDYIQRGNFVGIYLADAVDKFLYFTLLADDKSYEFVKAKKIPEIKKIEFLLDEQI